MDVLLGNEEDLQLGLGIEGQDVESSSKLDTSAFFGMIEQVKAKFPNVQAVATTLREVETNNRHQWGAVLATLHRRYSMTGDSRLLTVLAKGSGRLGGRAQWNQQHRRF